jgi:beta-lactamase superfamily II metal-dependent hydrolase
MTDFYEIDFLDVECAKSGDAITIRYKKNGVQTIHITDGGFQGTGEKIARHLKEFYDSPNTIDRVIVTHPDGDHAGGLRHILETYDVRELWMLRPWLYVDEIIDRFARFTNTENLAKRLKEVYPNIAALEEIAERKGVPIKEPFQGSRIGEFTVMAPTKSRYLDLVVESEKTPEEARSMISEAKAGLEGFIDYAAASFRNLLKAAWGEEVFSPNETSAENEMSVVQYAELNSHKILLTGDVGRAGLKEAAEYAPYAGLTLPGIDKFQVPHHGSRRNVSTETLDMWLGERKEVPPAKGSETFSAIVSAAKEDKHHPRNAVVRAMIHRGAKVITNEGINIRIGQNAPAREGWGPVTPREYPDSQEE